MSYFKRYNGHEIPCGFSYYNLSTHVSVKPWQDFCIGSERHLGSQEVAIHTKVIAFPIWSWLGRGHLSPALFRYMRFFCSIRSSFTCPHLSCPFELETFGRYLSWYPTKDGVWIMIKSICGRKVRGNMGEIYNLGLYGVVLYLSYIAAPLCGRKVGGKYAGVNGWL